MRLKLKTSRFLMIIATLLCLSTPLAIASTANAAVGDLFTGAQNQACQGITLDQSSNPCSSSSPDSIKSIMETVLNILSLVVGVAAIIMIIIGGFRYVVSGGNDQAVSGAKSTIIYALIGLIVALLAQTIVHFVLGRASA